jgi:lipopolysaccharide transport system ATP-binding protein
MSDVVISVENLSKRYLVGHRSGERERYVALRDVIAREARNFARKAVDAFYGRQIVQGDEVEEFWALKDVSFNLKRGEVIGIIGKNGAGKSTVLKILSRITEPTAGRVRLRGRVASLLEVGTGFHPELTGRENIFLNGAILGMSRREIRSKFDDIVAFAEVEKFLDTPVKHYSSGMYVRLAFAVAAHLEPEILIVDEVLAVGDAAFQKRCLGKMGEVAQGGRTVFFVSHNMNAVQRLCQRVIFLDQGRVAGEYDDARSGVIAYLKCSGQLAGANVWSKQKLEGDFEYQSEYFVPTHFELSSKAPNSQPGEPFSNKYPIEVTISGVIRRTDPDLNIGIGVYNENDELLFWTLTTDQIRESWPKLDVGPVRLRAVVPPRLLNEGTYRAELLASLHHRAWILEPQRNVPTVIFSIKGGLSDSPFWDQKRPGILGLVLSWNKSEG